MNSLAVGMVEKLARDKVGQAYEENKGWLSLDWIKDYFDVTNRYVLNKLRIIILPFTLKSDEWRRQGMTYEFSNEGTMVTPRGDL